MAGCLWWQLDSLADLITYRLEQQNVQTLTQEVTTASGKKITVTTTKKDTETAAAFLARHLAMVEKVEASH